MQDMISNNLYVSSIYGLGVSLWLLGCTVSGSQSALKSTSDLQADFKPYTEVIPGTEVAFDMVPIRGGKFMMGSPPAEPGRNDDEGPVHEVELSPFWMGKHEVTWD